MPLNYDKVFKASENWTIMERYANNLRWSGRFLNAAVREKSLLLALEPQWKKDFADASYIQNRLGANTKLMFGYAIEILLKAIQKKKTGNYTKSHKLEQLAKNIDGLELTEEEYHILKILGQVNLWAGRYSAPRSVDEMEQYHEDLKDLLREYESQLTVQRLDKLYLDLEEFLESFGPI